MYNTFFRYFGLRENPFNVNPDPGYLFLNEKTQALLEDMANAIQARKGLIVLTGEAGTGKTTLINHLKQRLQEQQTATAFIFNPHLEVDELFHLMLADFGILGDRNLQGSAPVRLNQWLTERYRKGKNAVLILDEAQGLPIPIFEQIRMLLNHEMPNEKLLQIVLSGQPELEDKLKRPDLRHIRQRISLRCHTTMLTRSEAHGFIEKRLQVAGGGMGRNAFASEAIDAAYLYSRGIPRVMNVLCEHAMIRACSNQIQPVPAYMIEEVARQLQFDDVRPLGGLRNVEPDVCVKEESLTNARFDSNPAIGLEPCEPEPASGSMAASWENARSARFETIIGGEPKTTSETSAVSARDGGIYGKRKPEPSPVSEFRTPHGPVRELTAGLIAEEKPAAPRAPLTEHSNARRVTPIWTPNQTSFSRFSYLRAFAPKVRKLGNELPQLYTRLYHHASGRWNKGLAWAKSLEWKRNLDSVLRWLQQPLATVKVQRRPRHCESTTHD
jgi:general secretion pathway protein A